MTVEVGAFAGLASDRSEKVNIVEGQVGDLASALAYRYMEAIVLKCIVSRVLCGDLLRHCTGDGGGEGRR
jgi:hypothetical protein